jgi:hypothetical protein
MYGEVFYLEPAYVDQLLSHIGAQIGGVWSIEIYRRLSNI